MPETRRMGAAGPPARPPETRANMPSLSEHGSHAPGAWPFNIQQRSAASTTMRAWERFLTGDPLALAPWLGER